MLWFAAVRLVEVAETILDEREFVVLQFCVGVDRNTIRLKI